MKIRLSDITISDSFLSTVPTEEKMNRCREFWNKNHDQDRFIVIDHNNTLVDGYIQYLVLRENNVSDAQVVVSEKKKKSLSRKPKYMISNTTYIYGVYVRKRNGMIHFSKEYIWRVPNSWVGWESDLLPGDKILVRTSNGLRKIMVTKIIWSNKCPVDTPVEKVFKKFK